MNKPLALAVFVMIMTTGCGKNEPLCIGDQCDKGTQGEPGKPGEPGAPGGNCSVASVSTGAVILCPDGSSAMVSNGKDGKDGHSCTVTQLSNGSRIDCTDDTHSVITNGVDGLNGHNGINGQDGTNGTNGTNGTDGRDGVDSTPSAFSITNIIDPCGAGAGFNEVLLNLANGQVLAHYADGAKQFFAVLSPGSYVTTDFSPCYFTLNSDGTLSNEHH